MKIWIIEIIEIKEIFFSKLPRINNTYAFRRHSNRFKWFMICVYLAIHYSLTENNTTNFGVFLTGRARIQP